MDKKYIEENEIEIKYLRNQLNDQELEEFEVYLMENPGAVEQLSLETVLVEAVPEIKKENPKGSQTGFLPKIVQGLIKAPYQLVGGLSVGVISSFIIMSIGASNLAYLELNQVGALSQLRSGGDPWKGRTILEFEAEKFRSSSDAIFALTVPADIRSGEAYIAQVINNDSGLEKVVLDVTDLQADQYGTLILTLKVNRFLPGLYRVEVSKANIGDNEKESEIFLFETRVGR